MKKDDSVYLENMLMYMIKLEKYVEPIDYDKFLADEAVQSHVIRMLEIIGEASVKVSKEIKDKYPDIIWAKLRGMRNILVHDYGNIQLNVVWNTSQTGIAPLKLQIGKIIKDYFPQVLVNYEKFL